MRRKTAPIPQGGASLSAPLLTPIDVASRCAVSMRTVRSWISSGRLRVLRLGARCVRVDPADLDRFLEQSKEM